MKFIALYSSLLLTLSLSAQGPYAPAANQVGTTAMHKDSSAFGGWASSVLITRGFQNIANPNSDTTTVGTDSSCFGIADGNVLSLGDNGTVLAQFDGVIYNGVGPDFAVFENSFNTTFLELAFVEVSSDGVNYFRFPSHSLTDTTNAVGSFGSVDPTNVRNLAGKYQASYGTPFDLEELKGIQGLDIQSISHIRIVDVVGSLDNNHAQRDSEGRKINDQYPTEFPSGGFDLDAIGVVYLKPVGIVENNINSISFYPNPSNGNITIDKQWVGATYQVLSIKGLVIIEGVIANQNLNLENCTLGVYLLRLKGRNELGQAKIIIR